MKTAGLVVIKNRKLLLAFSNNKQAFYLPGGKIDANETPEHGLIREIQEELNVTLQTNQLHHYTHITAPAFGEKPGIIMEQECFLYDLTEAPRPCAEIGALEYFNTADYQRQPQQVPGVITIMEKLKKENIID